MSIVMIVVAIILVPLLFIRGLITFRKQKCECMTFQKTFDRLIKENKFIIHYKDVFNNKVIALDRSNKKLLLLDTDKKHKVELCVKLEKIISCNLIQLKDEFTKCLKHVFLEIGHKENNKPIRFCFYDESLDRQDEKSCLLLKAQHWKQRINFHREYWWINPHEYVL